jgi:hypothetical protein
MMDGSVRGSYDIKYAKSGLECHGARVSAQRSKRVARGRGVRAVAPWHDRGSPAVIGTSSFRPVALRPRLSTGLPFSHMEVTLSDVLPHPKCRSVAQHSQVIKLCRGSQGAIAHIFPGLLGRICLNVATVLGQLKLRYSRTGPPRRSAYGNNPTRDCRTTRPHRNAARGRSGRRLYRSPRD